MKNLLAKNLAKQARKSLPSLLRRTIAFLFLVALTLLTASCSNSGTGILAIRPSSTDPAIKTFDSPHLIYINRAIIIEHNPDQPEDRHELLLWFPGTGGDGSGSSAFCGLAADLGYHVISLMYSDAIPATRCKYDADTNGFEKFRMAIIEGGETEHISVDKAESIENRLTKLLIYLGSRRPAEEWRQFLTADNSIKWESIAVGGQSQGGGHAALLAIKHLVSRVICTGAPKDYSNRYNAPAVWYSEDSATPKKRYFVFNHQQDPVGCTPGQLLLNLKSLKLDLLGEPADPSKEDPPYHHTRILLTSYPPVIIAPGDDGKGAQTAHTSVIAGGMASRWMDVWKYMLTESIE